MKKISILLTAAVVVMVSCNKESSKSAGSNGSLLVSVTDASGLMQVSATSFTSSDILNVQFTQTADSIAWWVTNPDSAGYVGDTAGMPRHDTTWIPPYIPPVDSSLLPPDTSMLPPITVPPNAPPDSSYFGYVPDSGTVVSPPIHDSSSQPPYPVDSFPPISYPDSTAHQHSGPGYSCSTRQGDMKIGITHKGNYQVSAGAYHRNANGSYSLIRSGYVLLSAK